MNQKFALTAALITLMVAGLLAVGSYYFVKPALEPDLMRPAAPPSPRPPAETAERDFQAVSLNTITAAAEDLLDTRLAARNPFFWPTDQLALMVAAQRDIAEESPSQFEDLAPEEEENPYTVKMILIGEMGKVALINRQMLHEGDVIHQNKVSRITPLEVILHTPEHEEIILTMAEPPRMIAPPPVDKSVTQRPESPSAIPREGDLAGQRRYLMEELRGMQE